MRNPPPLKRLVWIDRPEVTRDWINDILGDAGEEAVEPPWPAPTPHTLYVIDTNWNPLDSIPTEFLAAARALPGVGLYHEDEWLNEDYDAYRSFSYVIRTHWTRAMQKPFILTVPLGYANGGQRSGKVMTTSERPSTWFFAGSRVSSRPAMLRALEHIEGGVVTGGVRGEGQRLSHDEYIEQLRNTKFVPAPMGNVMSESFRLYEALEQGAIPILEKRLALDYHHNLLGDNPIPTFYLWSSAATFIRKMAAQPAACDELQQRIADWWSGYKAQLRETVQGFMADGDAGRLRGAAAAYRPMGRRRRRIWQYSELLRHQSAGSLMYRVKKAVRRGSLRRDMGYLKGPRF